MKLELVMLTTVISMITERQVEAQLRCYDNRNFNGVEVKLGTNPNIAKQFPNGPKACKVPANTTLILYSKPNYLGEVNTFHSGDDEEDLFTRRSFIARSLLILRNQSHQDGIFVFQQENFQGGLSQHFSKEIEKVRGNITFGSVVVIGAFDWTIVRGCHESDCQRKCLICLSRAKKRFGASFIRSINNTGMWETKTILPGGCLGKKYIGVSKIPECRCNQDGVVDGPDKCNGNKGKCQCNNHHAGDDCYSCGPSHVYRNGTCIACGCDPNGVLEKRHCLVPGICICKPERTGKDCKSLKTTPLKNNQASAVIYRPGKIDKGSPRLYLVTCTNNCIVVFVKSFGGTGGPLQLSVRKTKTSGFVCFESDFKTSNVVCKSYWAPSWKIGKKYFYVMLESWFNGIGKDVSVSVTLEGSVPTFVEVIERNVTIQKDKSGKEYLNMKSGSNEIKGLNYEHIKVECSGNCKGIEFSSGGGKGDVKLFGAEEEPAFIHQNACTNNCICESNDPGNVDVCKLPDGKRKFDLKSKFFWIHLAPNPSFENVDIQVTGDNIVNAYKHENIAKQHLTLTDGSLVLALSPTKRGEYKHMGVYGSSNIKNVKFQIFGAGKSDFEIRAGKTTKMDGNGVCNDCDCRGPCDTGFDTKSQSMYVTFKALRDINGVVYVKLFGTNIVSFDSYYFLSPTIDSI